MKKFTFICKFILIFVLIVGFKSNLVESKKLINTDYIHEFKEDINNIIDQNINTYFTLPDFTNYLEFKLDNNDGISSIQFIFDSTQNNYEYKIYSSKDGYSYDDVQLTKNILDTITEEVSVNISDEFVKIRFLHSESDEFIRINEIRFLDKNGSLVDSVEIIKDEPFVYEHNFYRKDIGYLDSIKGLISRTLGDEYVDFFNIELLEDNRGNDYFILYSKDDKIYLKGNNVNSISIALNYYFEHYLNQTFDRFGTSKLIVNGDLPEIDNIIEKNIDMKYRYNYNYVSYGYTMAYWEFEDWEREIDWMALNGFNMALNLVGHEEVVRRFLSEFGFEFSEITSYLTSPIYLPWQFMGNISTIGGELTPKWFEDRAKLSIEIQNRMMDFGISPIHQMFIGYFPYKENIGVNVIEGSYWSRIKGPGRLDFNNNDLEFIAKVFYDKQRELLGDAKYFAGDLFHEGGNSYGYNVRELSSKILNLLKDNMGNDAIWIIQSWAGSPSSDSIDSLDKDNIIIVDLHSQLNIRWKGSSKFNNMSWNNKEFENSNWIFGVLNNFGGRNGLYGHSTYLLNQFYDAKYNAEHLKGIGHTSEAIGFNNFIDELVTELIFSEELSMDEFINRYVRNRYGDYDLSLVEAFKILINTVYNPTTDIYHEGSSESIINARPSLNITSASKWGSIHRSYDTKELEKAFKIYLSKYDDFKDSEGYIVDLIDISSEVIINLASEVYEDVKSSYYSNDFNSLSMLKDTFLNLIKLQANILSYNDRKSLKKVMDKIDSFNYDDYFEDTLKYNKKTILTTWYDKLVSEDDGLRDYANTDFYDVIGTLYYNRWEKFFGELLSGKIDDNSDPYEDYRFDVKWINDDDSLEFNRMDLGFRNLLDLLMVEINTRRNDFSFVMGLVNSINNLF